MSGWQSKVRYQVVAVSILMAFILYLDRVCLGEIVKSQSFLSEFSESREQIGNVLGAFFFSYALFQIPAGWASDRFGGRKMLTLYIFTWSLLTGLTGLVTSIFGLLVIRLALGVAQAGAYPTSSGILRKWFRVQNRSMASGWISLGGRVGGAIAPFLTTILMLHVAGWRTVLCIYCLVGFVIAALYWRVVRDSPGEHERCNETEIAMIGIPPDSHRSEVADIIPMLYRCCLSRTLWLNSISQFCINVGWVFLITWLPSYLVQERGVDPLRGAWMVSLILFVGIPAQLLGGIIGDWSVVRFGLRWGRVLPLSMASTVGGIAYLTCPFFSDVWPLIIACGVVSLATDVGNPSSWAILQDIGGRNTSSIFAWWNMWGNLGAAFSAFLVPRLMAWGEQTNSGDLVLFIFCGGAFFVSALAVLGMDATKLVQEPKST
jgi:MFS family permease